MSQVDLSFYRALPGRVEAMKVKDPERERAIRLYCTTVWDGGRWALQIRSPISLSNGREGKDFIVSHAVLDREDMVALRDSLNAHLEEEESVK